MAKKPNAQRAQTQSDFANPDADKENIERIAAARAAENKSAGVGHNSDPSPEAIKRSFNAIEAALVEIDAAGRIMQKARAELQAAEKTAKTDLGSKSWVQSVKDSVKLKRMADKGGQGSIVTEHRQMGVVLKTMNVPLYTQFKLFEMPEESETTTEGAKIATPATAYLRGEHAYKEEAPADSNPFTPGSEQFVSWANGYADRRQAALEGVGLGNDGGTSNGITDGAAAH